MADTGGGGGGSGLPTMEIVDPLFRGKVVDLDRPKLSLGMRAGGAGKMVEIIFKVTNLLLLGT